MFCIFFRYFLIIQCVEWQLFYIQELFYIKVPALENSVERAKWKNDVIRLTAPIVYRVLFLSKVSRKVTKSFLTTLFS